MERIPTSFNDEPIFRKLGKVARYGTLTESQRQAYDHSLKVYRDNYAIAQTERSLGRAEGRGEERKSIVMSMWRNNLPTNVIAKYCNISVDEVEKIISESKS